MYIKRLIFIALTTILFISCGCGGKKATQTSKSTQNEAYMDVKQPGSAPIQYTYKVKNSFPHSMTSYTQGLYWHEGYLWESTGEFGRSAFLKVDLESGNILHNIPLEDKYFGEGAALLNNKIYQLTWMNQMAFVYDAESLEKIDEFKYQGEGWGITTDGEKLYMSNGTHEIYILNPNDFSREATIDVRMNNRRVREINELEWIDGKIWANIFMSDLIIIINPSSGVVEGVVDLDGILPESEQHPNTDVLNGIAYDKEGNRIFVTGKNWSKLFEIEIVKK